MAKKKKIKIPKSVLELSWTPKKYAKKHGIRVKGKGLSKGERRRNIKKLKRAYSESALNGLNKAVKILSENPVEGKKIEKVKDAVDRIVASPEVMERVAKLYLKNPKNYPNMIFLPNMIMTTLTYYAQENLKDEEKEAAQRYDKDSLVLFCEKILKKIIKRYKKNGLSPEISYQLASTIPTTKLLKSRQWYKKLIQQLYNIAEERVIDIEPILHAIQKVDKKKGIGKNDFLEGFYSEFMLQKSSNKHHNFNDSQKDLHDSLVEKTLVYLEGLKKRKIREILKKYIDRRKTAESYKNDTKRVIKFVDHANSNSPYLNIKAVVQDLIGDKSSNELYLS